MGLGAPGSTGSSRVASCQTTARDGIVGGVEDNNSKIAGWFWYLGRLNGGISIIAILALLFGELIAGIWIIAGLSGMLSCFAVAAIVQHLYNIDHRLNSNNKLLSQLIRAYGHEPEV